MSDLTDKYGVPTPGGRKSVKEPSPQWRFILHIEDLPQVTFHADSVNLKYTSGPASFFPFSFIDLTIVVEDDMRNDTFNDLATYSSEGKKIKIEQLDNAGDVIKTIHVHNFTIYEISMALSYSSSDRVKIKLKISGNYGEGTNDVEE
jgi:hypothetical protein